MYSMEAGMSLVIIDEDSYQVVIDLAYATAQNIAGRPVYTQAQCALHRDAAAALKRASEYARLAGLQLKIFDAYRPQAAQDRKSTRLNSSHVSISYAVFCL